MGLAEIAECTHLNACPHTIHTANVCLWRLHGCVLDFIHFSATGVAEIAESTNLKAYPHTAGHTLYLSADLVEMAFVGLVDSAVIKKCVFCQLKRIWVSLLPRDLILIDRR